MNDRFLLALGYGGDRMAAAEFEWEFRVLTGQELASDTAGREKFISDFARSTENGQEYAIPVEDPGAPYVRAFAEYAKQALQKRDDLFVFFILEEQNVSNLQFKIYLKKDVTGEEIGEHQIYCDGFDVPRDGLLWMQEAMGVRFYITEDRTEMMMEFPYNGPEELTVL